MVAASKGRILIADDEPLTLRRFARLLHRAGYEVETVEDGAQAIARFHESPFDAVLTDVTMPNTDGLAMLKAIHERDQEAPVVLMTAGPTLETAIRAVEYGAARYLTKPVESEALLEAVSGAVSQRRQSQEKRRTAALAERAADAERSAAELYGALDRTLSGLWMAMQPIVRCSTSEVLGYEALLRSKEPALPFPDRVLAAAEELDRLPELGRTIRARVASSIVTLPPTKLVFVNLHPQDLLDPELYDPKAPLSREAHRVILEVTERSSIKELKDLPSRLEQLRALGYRLALDDLGEGYAGLNSFSRLEPEVVKLDMSLVRGIHEHPMKRSIVRSIVTLCKDLDILVIAEGIESTEERGALRALDVDVMQGYLFARPGWPFPAPSW